MMLEQISIGYESEDQLPRAQQLSQQLELPINNQGAIRLMVMANQLALKVEPFQLITIDFNAETWQPRRDAGKQQALIRACKPREGMLIIDATAGWGRDAAVLASFGARVEMLERHPLMAVLLADALDRQDLHSRAQLKLKLLQVEAINYLTLLPETHYPDLIYLDPMHPARQKSALVKKEFQILQQLIGPDPDVDDLLAIARQRVKQAVVMKWPIHAAPIAKPTRTVKGKTVRFDIFFHQGT